MELRIALGEDRWANVQRSSYEDKIRNCQIDQLTIEELTFIAQVIGWPINDTLSFLISQALAPIIGSEPVKSIEDQLLEVQESCFETFKQDQFDIIIEECSELIKAVCKVKREYDFDLSTFRKNTPFTPIFISNLIEEVTDVEITFNYIYIYLRKLGIDYSNAIANRKKVILERLQKKANQPLEEKPMPEFDPDPIEDKGEQGNSFVFEIGITPNRFGDDIEWDEPHMNKIPKRD